MSSKLSASPRTAHTAITRMSSSRCSTFHSHLGSSTVSNAAIKVSSMAFLQSGKAEPLAGQVAELESLISCVTPGYDWFLQRGRRAWLAVWEALLTALATLFEPPVWHVVIDDTVVERI